MEYVRIDKEILDSMFEMMEYQSLVIAALYERCKSIGSGKWISAEATAELLCVSTRKVRTMKTLGQIGFVKHGRKCFFNSDDVYSRIKKEKNG